MFAGAVYNEAWSCIAETAEGPAYLEQSADGEPDDDAKFASPTQTCYIAAKVNQTFVIKVKIGKRSPEKKDLMVIVRMDGQEMTRIPILNSNNRQHIIDRFFTEETNDDDEQTIFAHGFMFSDIEQRYEVRRPLEVGKIDLEFYRGFVQKTGQMESKVIKFETPAWPSEVKTDEARMCIVPGPLLDSDPHEAVSKRGFQIHGRDRGKPWFVHRYEYRNLETLEDRNLITVNPNAPMKVPVKLPKRSRKAPAASASGTSALERRIKDLENTVKTLVDSQPQRAVRTPETPIPVPRPAPYTIGAGRSKILSRSTRYRRDAYSPLRSVYDDEDEDLYH